MKTFLWKSLQSSPKPKCVKAEPLHLEGRGGGQSPTCFTSGPQLLPVSQQAGGASEVPARPLHRAQYSDL